MNNIKMDFGIYDRCFIYDRMFGSDVLKTIAKLGRDDYLKSIFGSNAEGLLTEKSNVYFFVGNSTTGKKRETFSSRRYYEAQNVLSQRTF